MKRSFALLVAFLMLLAPLQAARDIRVTWQQLEQLTRGKKVAIVLPDAAWIEGNVLEVANDSLVVDVSKSSDKQLHPKGRTTVRRGSVHNLDMKKRGITWTVIGTAIGLGAGLAGAAPVNAYAHNEGDGAPGVVAAIIIVPAVLGFFLGRHSDNKTVNVTITD